MASDTPENLEKMLGENNAIEIETGASPSEVRLILKNVPGIEAIQTQINGDGMTWAKITEKKGEDARERVFMAFAAAKTPLLTLKDNGNDAGRCIYGTDPERYRPGCAFIC